MPQGLTQDQAKREFAKYGFELKEFYHNSSTPCLCVCSCGTLTNKALRSIRQGGACVICGEQKRVQKKRLSQQYVEQYFQKYNCTLLDQYKNSSMKMNFKCACGREGHLSFNDFQQGQHWCVTCGREKQAQAIRGKGNYKWNPNREQLREKQQISWRLRNVLKHCLERVGTSKEGHAYEQLGYSAQQLDEHLRLFPMFAYLEVTHTLAIDHILPVKAFVEHGIVDAKIICALDNLQPLSISENCEKNDWYLEEDFIQYCQKHNISLLKEVA